MLPPSFPYQIILRPIVERSIDHRATLRHHLKMSSDAIATDRAPLTAESGLHRLHAGPDVHRLNFAWLIRLRWVAIIGQTAVIVVSSRMPGIDFPYPILGAILVLEVLSNLALIGWARNTGRPRHEAMGGVVLIADIAFLTALLYFTGGAANPFSLLYFVHVALAALVLRPLWTWGVTVVSVGAYIGVHFSPASAHTLPWATSPEIWTLQTQGRWVAFGVTAAVIAFFINMIQKALARRDEELIRVRDDQMRNEKLASLATLAAGAAHEFSTPLSTIAVVANELRHGLEEQNVDPHFVDDAELIRDQVERCRDILQQMSVDAGESMGEMVRPVPIEEVIEHTLEGCRDPERVAVTIDTDRQAALTVPPTALGQALRGLVNNGLEASRPDQSIHLFARDERGDVVIEICDDGAGMDPEVLERVAEPFFTTKEAGDGMGLGVFLATTVIEKLGGELTINSAAGEGTLVAVRIPGSSDSAATFVPDDAPLSSNEVSPSEISEEVIP